MDYVAGELLRRRMSCLCGCLTTQQLDFICDSVLAYGKLTIMEVFALACFPEGCSVPGPQPIVPVGPQPPVPVEPTPGASCPECGGDGVVQPTQPVKPGVIQKGVEAVCNDVTRSALRAVSGFLAPEHQQYAAVLTAALDKYCASGSPADLAQQVCPAVTNLRKYLPVSALITVGAPLLALTAACAYASTGTKTQGQLTQLVDGASKTPEDVLGGMLTGSKSEDVASIIAAIVNPSYIDPNGDVVIDPYGAILGGVVAMATATGQAAPVYAALEALGITVGPDADIVPNNEVVLTDSELNAIAGALVGWATSYVPKDT